jgi:hypothetical protein
MLFINSYHLTRLDDLLIFVRLYNCQYHLVFNNLLFTLKVQLFQFLLIKMNDRFFVIQQKVLLWYTK